MELAARGIKTDVRAVWTFVHAEGLSFKKKIQPAEQDRPDVARKPLRWKAHQGRIDTSRLVFVDETLDQDQQGAAVAVGGRLASVSSHLRLSAIGRP